MNLQPVPTAAGGVVATAAAPLAHRCPFVDEADLGAVELRWRIRTHTLELHALRLFLDAFAPVTISHEALTLGIATTLAQVDGLDLLTVTTRWRTAGIDVACEVDGALLRQPVDTAGA